MNTRNQVLNNRYSGLSHLLSTLPWQVRIVPPLVLMLVAPALANIILHGLTA
ncbi:hypothetical protein [Glaciimonas immobilis]|uniref:Uncharacterized protein n=1 Tax=Glaciimonas immobilis TaxID=728004 RepID=A0A840RX01_9BURK|nr:hypothetical protein [Glaciimonas immobilis]KAF3998544.1 hypothetical protein HAV38_06725 [Glaciimonas immobilis]MBB5201396.1 hypothetical protein [Glaciimonas immobilis]